MKGRDEFIDENINVCPYCGAPNKLGAKQCSNCGENIEEGDQELY